MQRRAVYSASAPKAIGPYSQAISAGGWLYCSGQIALDPASGELVGGDDVRLQAERVMLNLAAVLEAGGSSFERVVKTTIYLTDMNDFALVNEIYGRFIKEPAPARATVAVAGLPKGVRVEIDAVARVIDEAAE